jgi:voltage-gated potassium channel
MTAETAHALRDGETPSLRARVHRELSPEGRMTPTARFLIAAILFATLLAILETEPMISDGHELWFQGAEMIFVVFFSGEYLLRLWCAPETGMTRLRWMRTPTAIVDLIAILGSLAPFIGQNTMLLRLMRVIRLVRIAKLGRFSRAFGIMERAVRSRASHFAVTLMLFAFFLVAASAIIFLVEGPHQPDKFGSIPRSIWWTAVTMTTVGYGDVVPVTVVGKALAAVISIGGIVLIAIPTGIIAASFSDEFASEEKLRREALLGNEVGTEQGRGSHP